MRRFLIVLLIALICIALVGCRKGDIEAKGFSSPPKYVVVLEGLYAGAEMELSLDGRKISGTAQLPGIEETAVVLPHKGQVQNNGTVHFRLKTTDLNLEFDGRVELDPETNTVSAIGQYQNKNTVCGDWTATRAAPPEPDPVPAPGE